MTEAQVEPCSHWQLRHDHEPPVQRHDQLRALLHGQSSDHAFHEHQPHHCNNHRDTICTTEKQFQ